MTPHQLRVVMKRLGLSVRGAAEATGYSPSTIQRWRVGTQTIERPHALAFAALELAAGGGGLPDYVPPIKEPPPHG